MKISLRRCHGLRVADDAFSHKIDYAQQACVVCNISNVFTYNGFGGEKNINLHIFYTNLLVTELFLMINEDDLTQ